MNLDNNNKGRRNELTALKFKKRLKQIGMTIDDARKPENNLYVFKSHGKPCSCWACRGQKYNRSKEKTWKNK